MKKRKKTINSEAKSSKDFSRGFGKYRENFMKKVRCLNMSAVIIAVLLLISCCTSGYCLSTYVTTRSNYRSAEFVLRKTMEFKEVTEIKRNMDEVKPFLSESLWKTYGLNDEDFTYYNFYKMRNSPCKISVVDTIKSVSEGTITYSIDNEYIANTRRFVMYYKIKGGKFVDIQFYELAGKM